MKRLCVYCGSSQGRNSLYQSAAVELGIEFARRDIELIYGGGSTGLMGAIADAALDAGGQVTGIIPKAIYDKEVGHKNCTRLYVVNSMHERKTMMAALSDGFVAMPGGYGTLEEFVEVLTWAQLGFHDKPCILLNIDGYYDGLLSFFDHMVTEKFVRPRMRDLVLAADNTASLLSIIETYQPIGTDKWLEQEDL